MFYPPNDFLGADRRMPISHDKHLRVLLQGIVSAKLETDFQRELYWHSLTNWIPESEVPRLFKETGIVFTGKEKENTYRSLNALRHDPRSEYLEERELNLALSKLMMEVIEDRAKYKDSAAIRGSIQNFLDEVLKPLHEYEILFKIHNMKVNIDEVRFWDVQIVRMSSKRLSDWGMNESSRHLVSREFFENENAMILNEFGNSSRRIEQRCRRRAVRRLRTLQAYLKDRYSNLHDFQLQLHISDEYLVRRVGKTALSGWKSSQPVAFDYENVLLEQSEAANTDYELMQALPKPMNEILQRALDWMGLSIQEPNYDIKIAHLCTALESILTSKKDARKGEKLAYRAYLISMEAEADNGLPPHRILNLYDLRSSIVHGSRNGIGSKQDYWTLYGIAKVVFGSFLKIASNRSLISQSKVFEELLRSRHLDQLLKWLESFDDRESRAIAEAIKLDMTEHQGTTRKE
ncbi:MAG: hypothetical protein AB7V18_00165 [Pyrinomonadaceae bacterium]